MHFAGMVGIGVLVGLAIGLTGIGSGSLLTPLLILSGGMSPVMAVGTSISFSFLTKLYGSWKFYRRGFVRMEIARDLSLGCLPGALLGAFVIRYLNLRRPDVMNLVLRHALGVALIVVAIMMAARTLAASKWPAGLALGRPLHLSKAHRRLLTILLAFGVGVSVTLTSVGGGAALIPVIFFLRRIDSSSLVGTDVFVGTFLAAIAGIPYAGLGHVDWRAVTGLVCGSIPALWVTTHLHGGLPRRITDGIIAGALMAMGVHIVVF